MQRNEKMFLEYQELFNNGDYTHEQLANKFNFPTGEAARSWYKRERFKRKANNTPIDDIILNDDLKSKVEMYEELLEQNGIKVNRQAFEPEMMFYPKDKRLDDTEKWNKIRKELLSKNLIRTFVCISDLHLPDHSVEYIHVWLKILEYLQPDVIFFNGDTLDLDAVSRYPKSKYRIQRDAIDEVSALWDEIIDAVIARCPNSILVAFEGNHENRIERYNNDTSSPLYGVTERTLVNVMRSNNRVLWLNTVQETRFGNTVIQHGLRASASTAKAALGDFGNTTNVTQGHTHRPEFIIGSNQDPLSENVGDNYVVYSCVQGTCSNIPAQYIKNTKQSKWLHAIVIGQVYDKLRTNMQLIVGNKCDNGIFSFIGNTIFTSW